MKNRGRASPPPSGPADSVRSLGGGILPEFVPCRLHATVCTNEHTLGFVHIFIQMGSYTAYHFAFSF